MSLQYEKVNGKDQFVSIKFDKDSELDPEDRKNILQDLNNMWGYVHLYNKQLYGGLWQL